MSCQADELNFACMASPGCVSVQRVDRTSNIQHILEHIAMSWMVDAMWAAPADSKGLPLLRWHDQTLSVIDAIAHVRDVGAMLLAEPVALEDLA